MEIALQPSELEYYRLLLLKVTEIGIEHHDKIDKVIDYIYELELCNADIVALCIYLMHVLKKQNIDLAKALVVTNILNKEYVELKE
jgi:hypothetical protein